MKTQIHENAMIKTARRAKMYKNIAQNQTANTSIFAIDKSAKICGAALDRSRNRKGVFTRNCGKLPYWTLIKLLLKNVKKTIFIMPPKFFNLKAKLIL